MKPLPFNSMKILPPLIVLLFLGTINTIQCQITLPSVFNDNMVLQQNFEAPIWGWAEPGTKISVSGSWSKLPSQTTIADKDGQWMLKLLTTSAGGPYELYINDIIIKNVMLGGVWICSGQSNMEWALEQSENAETEIELDSFPAIRLFYVARDNADEPSKDCYGSWKICNPENARTFSAVAYYFGKEIYQALNIPVGLIHVSWGGSTAQAWTNYNILQSTPEGQYYIEKYKEKIAEMAPGICPRDNQSPSGLYNAMLHPLIPFGIKGAIWYQGEANTNEHQMYENLLETMISNWRNEWNQGDFPFYYVQLAPYHYQKEIIGAALRDAQRQALEIPNTGMAVTLDIGNPDDIHPTNKKDVGKRLSLWALAKAYEQEGIIYSGPLYKSMQLNGNEIILSFDHTGSGLKSKGEKLTHFTMAGKDRIFYPAEATIEKNKVIVSSVNVKKPVAVRFAFDNGDEPNFFNKEGLPASTFRTDDWSIITETATIKSEYDKQQGFIISIETDSESEVRYSLDGNEPTAQSALYTGPFTINEDAPIKAKVFIDAEPSLLTSEAKIIKHLATGKNVKYKYPYNERYSAGGDLGLVNGVFGSTNFRDGNWQGFQGEDLDIIIDLADSKDVSGVHIHCMQIVNSWIVLPKGLEIYISENGENFTKVASAENEIPIEINNKVIHELSIRFEPIKTQYIKVIAKNFGPLPDWHVSAGEKSWLFVDEIIVE